MLCERCKIREATIKYTEIINGVKTEHNLCSHCAKEMDFGQYSALLDGEFPLGKLLSGLLGLEDDEEETDVRGNVVCPTCGTSFEDFVENSRFGCADCYGVFDLFINDKMKQLQGSIPNTEVLLKRNTRRQPGALGRKRRRTQTVWQRPVPRIPRPLWSESRLGS